MAGEELENLDGSLAFDMASGTLKRVAGAVICREAIDVASMRFNVANSEE